MGLLNESQYDWAKAEKEFLLAIVLNPSYPTAHQWYSSLLVRQGRFDEAITEARQAVELDPFSLIINCSLAEILYNMRECDQALEQCNKGIELDPNFPWNYWVRGMIAEIQGKPEEAIEEYLIVQQQSYNDLAIFGEIGRAYARAGRRDDAIERLHELLEYSKQGYFVACAIANVYYGLEDLDKTFEWLEKSIQNKEGFAMDLIINPLWDGLRSDQRHKASIKKIGLNH